MMRTFFTALLMLPAMRSFSGSVLPPGPSMTMRHRDLPTRSGLLSGSAVSYFPVAKPQSMRKALRSSLVMGP